MGAADEPDRCRLDVGRAVPHTGQVLHPVRPPPRPAAPLPPLLLLFSSAHQSLFASACRLSGCYDFGPADKIVDWALSRGLKVKGHTLCWHVTSPAWLEELDGPQCAEVRRRRLSARHSQLPAASPWLFLHKRLVGSWQL